MIKRIVGLQRHIGSPKKRVDHVDEAIEECDHTKEQDKGGQVDDQWKVPLTVWMDSMVA